MSHLNHLPAHPGAVAVGSTASWPSTRKGMVPHCAGGGPGRSRLGLVSAAALLLAFVVVRPALAASGPTAPDSSFHANFNDVALTDQEGRVFRMSSLKGKVVLVNFVYTGCSTTCPIQTRALAEVQRALPASTARGLRFVSVSVDPLNDTPAALKAFALRMGADLAGWTFATGRPQDIELVSEKLRLFGRDKQAKRPEDHATSLWLVDGRGRLMQRYSGNPPEVARLVRELSLLQSGVPAAASAAQ